MGEFRRRSGPPSLAAAAGATTDSRRTSASPPPPLLCEDPSSKSAAHQEGAVVLQVEPPSQQPSPAAKRKSAASISGGGQQPSSGHHQAQHQNQPKKQRGSVLDPSGCWYHRWCLVVSLAFLYNFWSLSYRFAFREIDTDTVALWCTLDYSADLIYFLDVCVQFRTGYLEEGVLQRCRKKIGQHYLASTRFHIDCLCLLPFDFLYLSIGYNSIVRCNRLFKIYKFWCYVDRTERHTNYPNVFRTFTLVHYTLVIFHWNACLFHMISRNKIIDIESLYKIHDNRCDDIPCQYLHAFYWSTLALTAIGDLPRPRTRGEYFYVTFELFFGLFLFASVLGHVANIVTNVSAARKEFQAKLDAVKTFMRMRRVSDELQNKVIRWFDYLWVSQQSSDEERSVACLPDRLKAEIAIHVHLDTLKRVDIFQNTEAGFLCELVLRLKPVLFSPGDFVCRKNEVGHEMYIVSRGVLEVVGEGPNQPVVATLKAGNYFGEISVLNVGLAGNKRTASVRSVGYSDLFCLNKQDLWDVLKNYPAAEARIRARAEERLSKLVDLPHNNNNNNNSNVTSATGHQQTSTLLLATATNNQSDEGGSNGHRRRVHSSSSGRRERRHLRGCSGGQVAPTLGAGGCPRCPTCAYAAASFDARYLPPALHLAPPAPHERAYGPPPPQPPCCPRPAHLGASFRSSLECGAGRSARDAADDCSRSLVVDLRAPSSSRSRSRQRRRRQRSNARPPEVEAAEEGVAGGGGGDQPEGGGGGADSSSTAASSAGAERGRHWHGGDAEEEEGEGEEEEDDGDVEDAEDYDWDQVRRMVGANLCEDAAAHLWAHQQHQRRHHRGHHNQHNQRHRQHCRHGRRHEPPPSAAFYQSPWTATAAVGGVWRQAASTLFGEANNHQRQQQHHSGDGDYLRVPADGRHHHQLAPSRSTGQLGQSAATSSPSSGRHQRQAAAHPPPAGAADQQKQQQQHLGAPDCGQQLSRSAQSVRASTGAGNLFQEPPTSRRPHPPLQASQQRPALDNSDGGGGAPPTPTPPADAATSGGHKQPPA